MKKILFTLLVMLTASFGYASDSFYDFLEDSIAYNVLDSTAKTVEVTYNIRPAVITASRTDLQPGMNKFDKSTGENIGSSSQIMKAAAPQYEGIPYDSITTLTIPGTVTHNGTTYSVVQIGERAFWGNHTIKTLTLPTSVKYICSYAFSNNDIYSWGVPSEGQGIGSIIMPEGGLDSIAPEAFRCCTNLTKIVIPDCVKKLGERVFDGCINLESVTIGSNVDNIDGSMFSYCFKLKDFKLHNNPYYTLVDSVLYSADKTRLVSYPAAIGTTYSIPEGVRTIGSFAFYERYITDVNFPSTLLSIERSAFYETRIVKADLNEGLKTIGISAFAYTHNLNVVVLPSTVKKIEDYAFSGSSVSTFNCKIAVPLVVSSYALNINTDKSKCKLYVPKGTIDAYKAAPVWKDFNIIEGPEGVDNVNAAKTVAGVKYVNAAGLQSSKPFEGVNVVVTTYTDGTTSVAKQIKK